MRALELALRQLKYQERAFRRNPPAAFFTIAFPLIFLVILNVIFGSNDMEVGDRVISGAVFYVPAIATLTVVNSCYTSLSMTWVFDRDGGVLKRIRGSPLPGWAFLFGRITHAILLMLVLLVVVVVFGRLFYGVDIPGETMPAVLVTLAVGSFAFCTLGLSIAAVVPNSDAAPAVVNGTILPLLFISDVFIPPSAGTPAWVEHVSSIFPVRHLSEALQTAFNPFTSGAGFEPLHLGVLAAWGVAGLLFTLRFSSWEPRV
ncbi:MAG: ABC transporter permease [Chloroflexi bacterium]|nr:ABC transporter permease [Chloroflexota bacterium]